MKGMTLVFGAKRPEAQHRPTKTTYTTQTPGGVVVVVVVVVVVEALLRA